MVSKQDICKHVPQTCETCRNGINVTHEEQKPFCRNLGDLGPKSTYCRAYGKNISMACYGAVCRMYRRR